MKYFWLAIGIAAGLSVGLTLGWFKGRSDTKASIQAKISTKQIEVYKDGKKLDEEVFNADDSLLCDMLGTCELQNNGESN